MSGPLRIQRKRKAGWKMPANTICVTRPGRYGNPFRVGENCVALTNEEMVDHFRHAIDARGGFYSPGASHLGKPMVTCADIERELRGKNLCCWCALCAKHDEAGGKPLNETCPDCTPCHVDPLGEIANR